MAVDFVAAGTAVASIDALTVTWPGMQSEGDVALLLVESNWLDTVSVSDWTELASSPQGTSAGAHKLSVFRKVVGASESSVSIADPGNHGIAQILVFSGVDTTTPINVSSGYSDTSALTALTIPAATTTESDCAIVHIAGTGRDTTSTIIFSDWNNSNLVSITEVANITTALGGGGGFGAAWGILSAAGSSGTASVTQATAVTWSGITVALTPASGSSNSATETSSGSIAFSGDSSFSAGVVVPASPGNIAFSGGASALIGIKLTPTGSITFTGTATEEHSGAQSQINNSSGSVTFSGDAGVSFVGTQSGSFSSTGSISFSGDGSYKRGNAQAANGSLSLSGDASKLAGRANPTVGNVVFSGNATGYGSVPSVGGNDFNWRSRGYGR